MNQKYYSEYGEDRWIVEHLPLPERGVYLDIGAGHPECNSNTAFLRDRGWVGLATDGNADYGPHWIGRQQFCQALFSSQPAVRFDIVRENSAISRITDDVKVPLRNAVTLEYFLNCTFVSASPPIKRIDFLSIDVEGAEFDVFQTFDWKSKWYPRIIVAEYNTLGIGEDFRLRDQLVGTGLYRVVHQTVANLIYERVG